jgi:undecaprenyl pyrophosphate synthase
MTQTPKIKSEEEMREEWEEYSTSFRFVFNDSDTPDYWLNIIKERDEKIQNDINSVLNMLEGETDREQIVNFINEFLKQTK